MDLDFQISKKLNFIFVSNRSPYIFEANEYGRAAERNTGGLVSAIEKSLFFLGGKWIAWDGNSRCRMTLSEPKAEWYKDQIKLISLSQKEVEKYYNGFCNGMLWPLCHYFLDKCRYAADDWESYVKVNQRFASHILDELTTSNITWIHDYHLALTPRYLRESSAKCKIAYFWHIPFPSIEIFRMLPRAKDLLMGILHSDIIGFHTEGYVSHFLDCIHDLLYIPIDRQKGIIYIDDRRVRVCAIPLGVDCAFFEKVASLPQTKLETQSIRQGLGTKTIALGVDRLDYTKGILERIKAVAILFERHPELRRRFTLLQIAAPTRGGNSEYRKYQQLVEDRVKQVNRRFGTRNWVPISYIGKSISWPELIAYYCAADLVLVTSIRDGMNLVAKEYVAARTGKEGIVILSEFAGVAEEFDRDALLINPFNIEGIAQSIQKALELSSLEKMVRMKRLQEKIRRRDFNWWIEQVMLEIGDLQDLYNSETRGVKVLKQVM